MKWCTVQLIWLDTIPECSYLLRSVTRETLFLFTLAAKIITKRTFFVDTLVMPVLPSYIASSSWVFVLFCVQPHSSCFFFLCHSHKDVTDVHTKSDRLFSPPVWTGVQCVLSDHKYVRTEETDHPTVSGCVLRLPTKKLTVRRVRCVSGLWWDPMHWHLCSSWQHVSHSVFNASLVH